MEITGVSLTDLLASQYAAMASSNLQTQIAVSVLKIIQESQQQAANQLVEMIRQSTTLSLEGAGRLVDRLV